MNKSICYLSSDYYKYNIYVPPDAIICPELAKNGEQIKMWVSELKTSPQKFFTTSLYLIRELELQHIDVKWVNIIDSGTFTSECVDNINDIEVLDRELEQSERYMNHNISLGYR